MLRVVVAGAAGKMGKETIKAITQAPDMVLVGALSPSRIGEDAGTVAGLPAPLGVVISHDAPGLLEETRPDVVVDFTRAEPSAELAAWALASGAHFVTGTTGFSPEALAAMRAQAEAAERAVLVAPNFAIGALLMIEFAQRAAKYFDHAEIIELHHNQKVDAPSGTALKTAEAMQAAQARFGVSNVPETEKLPGARGAETGGIHIHSVRLPGLLAHQEVLFGGLGQVLTIKHDALSRECYMPGVLLAIRRVGGLSGLTHGLEHIL